MLVNCVVYQDGRKLGEVEREEIHQYLGRPDCLVWVALRDAKPEELGVFQEQFDLHELAVEDAHHGHQRPKLEEYADSLFVVLHTIEIEGGDLEVGEVDIFVGKNYVLSTRSGSRQGFANVRERCERRICCSRDRVSCSTH